MPDIQAIERGAFSLLPLLILTRLLSDIGLAFLIFLAEIDFDALLPRRDSYKESVQEQPPVLAMAKSW